MSQIAIIEFAALPLMCVLGWLFGAYVRVLFMISKYLRAKWTLRISVINDNYRDYGLIYALFLEGLIALVGLVCYWAYRVMR